MPAPSLTVTAQADRRRCLLTVTSTPGDTVTVWRVSASGTGEVRGAVEYAMPGATAIFADYELPQNVAVSYFVVGVGGTSAAVSAGTFDFGGDVIFDLGRPGSGLLVVVESFPESKYTAPRDVVSVWDREDPVVVSGERSLPSGTLNLITLSLDARSALLDALRSGNVVAFSPWKPEYGVGSPAYFSVGDVTESRTSPLARESSRRWALDVQQVAPPRAAFVPPIGDVTWQNVLDSGDTWADLLPQDWYEVSGF